MIPGFLKRKLEKSKYREIMPQQLENIEIPKLGTDTRKRSENK